MTSERPTSKARSPRRNALLLVAMLAAASLVTLAVTMTLVTMFEHKQDARSPYLRVVELDETSVDPALWAKNWPRHYEQYRSTAGDEFYGGSSALPESKLDAQPWLKRLYAGYAFSIDYREARGHAYMLYDQVVTERVNQRQQAGACLHCHASTSVLYRKVGLEAMGLPADHAALAADFNMDAVIRGFEELSTRGYHEVLALASQMPDGTPDDASGGDDDATFPSPPVGGFDPDDMPEGQFNMSEVHPVACIDCHDPQTMSLRITRPGFMQGIAELASSDAAVPHLPSVEQWRRGDREESYDPNQLATRQEMRSFTCGQCHVEYYCASKTTLTFPWGNGLKVEDLEQFWDELEFPDGTPFHDYKHGETGGLVYKAQHPEFELWSQGIHARAGVSCADCHMPYEREGAMKLSNHNVRSPMENINSACQTCHNVPEQELRNRVDTIQSRTVALTERAGEAMSNMVDAILEAQASGASDEQLAAVFDLQRKAMWRLDYISSENSKGFHADQEAARILAESIDYSRQAEASALRLRTPGAPDISTMKVDPPTGITTDR
jgi:nitrite reductase (cytochrome c-552)